jgi:hypothetical protein
MTNSPNEAVDYILKNSKEYAKAKSQRVYLEEFRKTKKALLMKEALTMGVEAANAQEREAYAHEEYRELLLGLAAAIEVEERLKWNLEAARMRVDVWRSQEASNRLTDKVAQ